MGAIKNILFVMYDQLRWDYLSCAGHPHLKTPHWDALAARGVRFSRAYCQSPICGASRMSFYTGRYVDSHGASHNMVPLKAGEVTLGDHLRKAGMDAWLIGKTHMAVDAEGMARLGLTPESQIGARVAECGFDVWERDDGMRPDGPAGLYDPGGALKYNDWLRAKGYDSENPWHDFANSARTEDGELASGWFLLNSSGAAEIEEPDSETPYLTTRAMEFMEAQAGPWMCHLSFIKPHWPYIAPEPYASMYGRNHVPAAVRSEGERADPHPVFGAFMEKRVSEAFSRDDVRDAVIPAYMGLVKQCDDQFGRLIAWMEETGRMEDTMIVVTSDHGDYLGDHWMGEKELFHDCSARIPMIVYDPRPEADAARGTVCEALVESLDLAATFIEAAGGEVPDHVVEGRSLLPFLEGRSPETWREVAISEFDYGGTPPAAKVDVAPREAALVMVF
ncbi:MAG: sulfatase-like hydrolase/transferase, partial [Pseudomonadota bacterium]